MKKKFIPAYLLTLVNILGFSILIPVLPFIVESYGGEKWMYGTLITLYSSFQFIGAPYFGSLSDSMGRKPVLLMSQAGTLLSWLIFLFALTLPNTPMWGIALPLWVIGLSRILDGITGGNTSATLAYISDITDRHEKSYIFGYIGAIVGIGMIVGPGLGGITSQSSIGYKGTLITAAIISIITLITIAAWVKESLPKAEQTERKRQSIFSKILILRNIRKAEISPFLKLVLFLKFCFSIVMAFYMSTVPLFLIDLFDFNEKELGSFMFVVGIFLSFNQGILLKQFVKRLGVYNTLKLGLALSCIGLICITLTSNFWLFVSIYYIMNLGISLSFPNFNSLVSTYSPEKKQGEVMGISESINSLCLALFPVLGATLYGIIQYKVYYIMACLPFIAFLLSFLDKPKEVSEKSA